MLGRFRKLFASDPREVTLGFACSVKNRALDTDLFGSPRELGEAVVSECGLSLAEVIEHVGSEVALTRITQAQPLLNWNGGPKAERLMRLLDIIATGNTQALAEYSDVLSPSVDGSYAPLVSAAARDQHDIVLLLLELGASVDLPGNLGMTALHWASARGHQQVAVALVQSGASANVFNWFGFTPAELAAINDHRRLARILAPRSRFPSGEAWMRFAVDRIRSNHF